MNITGTPPEHILKLMDPEDRKALGKAGVTREEAAEKHERKAEKDLHVQFEQWLRLKEIDYVHCRMDKPSTIEKGWPDFTCMKGNRFCLVELKAPGGKLREEQAEVIARLSSRGIETLVTDSLKAAIEWVIERLL